MRNFREFRRCREFKKFKNLAPLASLLVLFAMILSACGGSTGSTSKTSNVQKVALVTDVGGLNDQGFNQLSYQGYKKAEAQYGYTEKVIQTQSQNDYVQNLTAAAQSANLVIAVGFLMETPLDQVAKQFPSKKFAIVDGCAIPAGQTNCDTLPNVAPLFFKEQEAGCLVGAIAGQMEVDGKSKVPNLLGKNTISAVGGLSIPPVNHYIAGYKYCAQKVDPSVNVLIGYSNTFNNTAACKDMALSQINQHQADIVFQVAGGCGVGALDAANQKNVYAIGVDSNQGYIHPNTIITSALKRVDTAVYDTIVNFETNKFTNNPPVFDLAANGVGYAPVNSAVPADAKAKADEFAAQIKAGTLVPPATIP
jgi:basic membrane protein A